MKRIIFALVLFSLTSSSFATFRFASYNIRNFDYDVRSNTPTNKGHLVNIMQEMQADLISVQEINKKEEFERMIAINFNGDYRSALSECGGAHGQKLGFVYNTNKMKLISFKEDLRVSNPNQAQQSASCNNGSRPLAIAIFKRIDTNEKIVAISVHLKAGGRDSNIKKRFKQLNILSNVIKEFNNSGYENVVVMGDFNSTEYILKNNNYKKFTQTVSRMNMVDTTKDIKCSSYWWGGADDFKQYPSTLDHILLSKSLLKDTSPIVQTYGHCKKLKCAATLEDDMGISFDEVSDHCPILTEVK